MKPGVQKNPSELTVNFLSVEYCIRILKSESHLQEDTRILATCQEESDEHNARYDRQGQQGQRLQRHGHDEEESCQDCPREGSGGSWQQGRAYDQLRGQDSNPEERQNFPGSRVRWQSPAEAFPGDEEEKE